MRPDDLPDYEHPPISEVAVGVLFEPLRQFRQGHFGLFWQAIGSQHFPTSVDQPRLDVGAEALEPQFQARIGFELIGSAPTQRAWFISGEDTRVVQLQDDRLIYNWRARGDSYPRFEVILDEFSGHFGTLERVLSSNRLGELKPRQVEVTYINQFVGDRIDQFLRTPPLLRPAGADSPTRTAENEDWMSRYLIRENGVPIGRLQVECPRSPQRRDGSVLNGYQLALTYREPIVGAEGLSEVRERCLRARDVIVRTFTDLTVEDKHAEWGRIQ